MAPLVLPVHRASAGMLWVVVSSTVPMVRVTQAMHRVTVGPVCVIGDALGTGRGGPERGLPWVLRVTVALVMPVVGVLLVMGRLTVLLVMSMVRGGVGGVVGVGGEGFADATADCEGAVGGAVGGTVGDSDAEGVASDAMSVGVVNDARGEGAAGLFMGYGDVGGVRGGGVVGDTTGSGAACVSDNGEDAAVHWGRPWQCR